MFIKVKVIKIWLFVCTEMLLGIFKRGGGFESRWQLQEYVQMCELVVWRGISNVQVVS